MIGYLLVCFVDTEKVSHNQKQTEEIISFINRSDILDYDFTFLFKSNHFDVSVANFLCKVPDFLNDPLGVEKEDEWEDEEDDFDEIEMTIRESQAEEEPEVWTFPYEDDYTPLFIQFVTSDELFKAFCDHAEEFDIYNCEMFSFHRYTISSLDQMEILRRIQRPQTDDDSVQEILLAQGDKRKGLLKKFNNKHRN